MAAHRAPGFLLPMTKEQLVALAESIARIAHKGQTRWSGAPYITHPEAVAAALTQPEHKLVAWLHDVLEDCPAWTAERLVAAGIPGFFVDTVVILTHKKDENYFDYIQRISESGMASTVKVADLEHNISDLKPGCRRDKYLLAREVLLLNS
jgi:(p)ppGpp synthase/HD superfamily hydrolase